MLVCLLMHFLYLLLCSPSKLSQMASSEAHQDARIARLQDEVSSIQSSCPLHLDERKKAVGNFCSIQFTFFSMRQFSCRVY